MVEAIYQNLRSRLGEIQVACLAPLRCFQASNSSYTKDEVDNFTCTASYSSILSIFIPSSCEIKQVCSAGRIGRHQPALGIQSIRSRLAWKMPVPQSPPNRTCLWQDLTSKTTEYHGHLWRFLKSEVEFIQTCLDRSRQLQDVTHYSLPYGRLETVPETTKQCIFWGFGSATWQCIRWFNSPRSQKMLRHVTTKRVISLCG